MFYSVEGQTKSVVFISVSFMAAYPPSTSIRLLKPLAFKIDSAISHQRNAHSMFCLYQFHSFSH